LAATPNLEKSVQTIQIVQNFASEGLGHELIFEQFNAVNVECGIVRMSEAFGGKH
jgi:hypothetical protein